MPKGDGCAGPERGALAKGSTSPYGLNSTLKITRQLIKDIVRGRWGCWKNFIVAPFVVSLLCFQTLYKGHLRRNRRFPLKYKKEPHYKVLEVHTPADLINNKD